MSNLRFSLRILWSSFLLQARDRATNNFFVTTLFILPVIFTLVSVGTYLYGGRQDMGMYAVIGAGMIGIWNSNLWTSGRIVENERRLGTMQLLIGAPTPFVWILVGKSLSNAVASVLSMAMTFLTGLVAFNLPLDIRDPGAFLAGLFFTLVAQTCLGLVLGSFFVITRNAGTFISAANYPIFVISGLTFPLTMLPMWLQTFSKILAPTWGNLALNAAAGVIGGEVWTMIAWLAGLSLVYLLIARFIFARVEYLVRKAGSLEVW